MVGFTTLSKESALLTGLPAATALCWQQQMLNGHVTKMKEGGGTSCMYISWHPGQDRSCWLSPGGWPCFSCIQEALQSLQVRACNYCATTKYQSISLLTAHFALHAMQNLSDFSDELCEKDCQTTFCGTLVVLNFLIFHSLSPSLIIVAALICNFLSFFLSLRPFVCLCQLLSLRASTTFPAS